MWLEHHYGIIYCVIYPICECGYLLFLFTSNYSETDWCIKDLSTWTFPFRLLTISVSNLRASNNSLPPSSVPKATVNTLIELDSQQSNMTPYTFLQF